MSFAKSRLCGAILLILAAAVLLTGFSASRADREGTLLNAAFIHACDERQQLADASAAVTAASDALERAGKRASDAISDSEACISAAEAALETEQSGNYDGETDVGALGQAILDVQDANLDSVLDAYSPVYNAALLESLTNALTNVKRAESAAEDAAIALQTVIDAALVLDPAATFAEIPALSEAVTTELGALKNVRRYLTRAENYLARSQTAQSNTDALKQAATDILANAQAVIAAHPASMTSVLVTFANQRAIDLLVVGGLLLIAGLALLLIPGKLAKRWKSPLFRKGTLFTVTVALLAAALHYANGEMWDLMRQGVFDTLYMTIPSTFFAYVLGLPLGVLLVITAPGHIRPNATLNNVVGTIINFLRSIPFIILLVMLFDVTRIVMGTAIGTRAIIFPLFVSAFPYVARIVEGSLNEVDHGVIEAAESMGSTTWQIIRKVLIPEAMPSLINGAAICMTTILAYTAMAGSAGGDGLGKIAITYGLNYREYDIMYISSLLLVALVQIIQIAGGILMRAADHRKK